MLCTDDGPNFMNGEIKVMAGYDNLIFGNATLGGGKDGILPNDRRLKPDSKL